MLLRIDYGIQNQRNTLNGFHILILNYWFNFHPAIEAEIIIDFECLIWNVVHVVHVLSTLIFLCVYLKHETYWTDSSVTKK